MAQKDLKPNEISKLLSNAHVRLLASMELLKSGNLLAFKESEEKRCSDILKLESIMKDLPKIIDEARARRKKTLHEVSINENTQSNLDIQKRVREKSLIQARQVLKNSVKVMSTIAIPCFVHDIGVWLKRLDQPKIIIFTPHNDERKFVEELMSLKELEILQKLKTTRAHFSTIDIQRWDWCFSNLETDLMVKFSFRVAKPKASSHDKYEQNMVLENVLFYSMFEEKGRMTHDQITKKYKIEYHFKTVDERAIKATSRDMLNSKPELERMASNWDEKERLLNPEEKFLMLLEAHKSLSINVQTSQLDFFNQLSDSFKQQIEEKLMLLGESLITIGIILQTLKEVFEAFRSKEGPVCRKCRQFGIREEGSPGLVYPTFLEKRRFVHQRCLDRV